MRNFWIAGTMLAIGAAMALSSTQAQEGGSEPVLHHESRSVNLDDLDWVAEPWGAEFALVWGDMETGPTGMMVRLPTDQGEPPLHAHTHPYSAVVISGSMKHWAEGETEEDAPLLTAGGYFYQSGGQFHQDRFSSDEPTVLYAIYEGPRDVIFKQE